MGFISLDAEIGDFRRFSIHACQRRLKTRPLLPVEKWTTPGVVNRTA